MFQPFIKFALGGLILFSSIPSSLAETVSFEGLSTMPLSNVVEQDTVSYLAYIDSQKKASQEALKYLKQQNFFKQGKIDSQYYSALVRMLSIDTLSFSPSSSNPNEIQFKTKFKFDSFEFPENLKNYFQEHILAFSMFQYQLKREQEFEAQVRQFLKKINNTQDEEYRKFLQETEGTKISNYVKASQMIDLAHKYKVKEEFEKAQENIDAAIKLSPQDEHLYYIRASFYQEQEKYDASIQDLNKAIELSPKEPLFYLMRGLSYMSQGIVYKRANEDYSKAIELNPNLSMAYLWRGYVFQYQGNCPASDTDFKKACELGLSSACTNKCKRF